MNNIKNCDWQCNKEVDGNCPENNRWAGKCDCMQCECFFDCSGCKRSSKD